jgi:hypothetical protein
MRISTVALVVAFAISGPVALAQDAGGSSARHVKHHKSQVSKYSSTEALDELR